MTALRIAFWIDFIRHHDIQHMAEIGVWRGEFAEAILRDCPSVTRYYMIDPWRHLDNWAKPLNVPQPVFDEAFSEAMSRIAFAADRRVVLRGTTAEMIDEIANASLDLAYIDGDHTLRGIAIDLQLTFPKVKRSGFVAGDDFSPTIWQHSLRHEPTMVFPFAVHFAEAVNRPITALPNNQFLIEKDVDGFAFKDPDGRYADTTVRNQIDRMPSWLDDLRASARRWLRAWRAILPRMPRYRRPAPLATRRAPPSSSGTRSRSRPSPPHGSAHP
jgi:hypothetical protein